AGRRLVDLDAPHGNAEHVGLDLIPQRAARATADAAQAGGRGCRMRAPHRLGVEHVLESDALEHGPGQMASRMNEAESGESAAHVRLVGRGAALEMGDEERAVGTRGYRAGI